MRYIIYTRVSTNKQTVENQLHDCRKYVYDKKKKGDEVVEFAEPDTSTFKPMENRKKLMEMMEYLRSGDELVVWKVDRLARDKQELINIYCDIRKKGVHITGLNDPSLNEESICIYAFIACSERKNIQERTKCGLARKRANGERVGTTLYGYKLDENKLSTHFGAKSHGKPYLLLLDEVEQRNIKIVKELHDKGLSFQEIADQANLLGCRNRAGNPFQKMTVWRILDREQKRNPAPLLEAVGSSR